MGETEEYTDGVGDATSVAVRHATKRRRRVTTDDDLDAKLSSLERAVYELDDETGRLEGKAMVLARMPWYSTRLHDQQSSRVIHVYLQMFQYGFKIHNPVDAVKQERFLRSVCRDDMVFCGGNWSTHGVDKLIHAFRIYSSLHPNYIMHPKYFEVVRNDEDNGDVVCDVQCTVSQRLTRETVAVFFPHIMNQEHLVQILVGRDILVDTNVSFGFTPAGLIDAFTVTMSREKAFAQLLGVEAAAMLADGQQYLSLVT
ncbi:hypothetical protein H310_09272 [Aphanomyces invadans]|uniref:NTF2 domain-containing protein n=1 Tax=Aphanomyces invadans TaxID=157072 RepID=A0A024TVC3_9STRA|nr:hypothetical protein H310_09272 [Aphanomyces invadans]ETV97963.1 hypothetical protein H310_09272 [Aphanomyces invadans]|eukprot:XP_008873524.1 hypothetical protein H310_09272 [Aphanomyces invadans]